MEPPPKPTTARHILGVSMPISSRTSKETADVQTIETGVGANDGDGENNEQDITSSSRAASPRRRSSGFDRVCDLPSLAEESDNPVPTAMSQGAPAGPLTASFFEYLQDNLNEDPATSYPAKYLSERYDQMGDIADLIEVIRLKRASLELYKPGHPSRNDVLDELALCLVKRYDCLGDVTDLSEALRLSRESIQLGPLDHPSRGTTLANMVLCLSADYDRTGKQVPLDEAICFGRASVEICTLGHPSRHNSLNHLALCLSQRYNHAGELSDLEEAIRLCQESLELRPSGHPSRHFSLSHLASYLSSRYDKTGDRADLEEAIRLDRESLDRRPPGHPWRHDSLGNLASYLSSRYNQLGNQIDLEEATRLNQECLELRPRGHPWRDVSLCNLALLLFSKYGRSGDQANLEEAIRLTRESLELRPPEHPWRDFSLGNLASYLCSRYDKLGDQVDLVDAIHLNRECLELRPPGHPSRHFSLGNLASNLFSRYRRLGEQADLEEAVRLDRECLQLRPSGHPSRHVSLGNLASYLSSRFNQLGDQADLEEAIRLNRECLELRPAGHPWRDISLCNLALLLFSRYGRLRSQADLEEAIRLGRESLELRPSGHPWRDISLGNLASYLCSQYCQIGDQADLEEAIRLTRESLVLRPPGHLYRSWSLRLFAQLLIHRLDHPAIQDTATPLDNSHPANLEDCTGQQSSMTTKIVDMLKEATLHSTSLLSHRIRAANDWRQFAKEHSEPSELKAAKEVLKLVEIAVFESSSLEGLSGLLSTDHAFKDVHGAAADAAALAIDGGNTLEAVSLLEQGRSTMLTQLGRYRWAIDDVRKASPHLATQFAQLSSELNAIVLSPRGLTSDNTLSPTDDSLRHYKARTAWNKVIEDIRKSPGFESFLLPPPFESLQEAADKGPVVVVNVNERRSDAIIILSSGPPTLVPLPEAHPTVVCALADRLGKRPAEVHQDDMIMILREVWRIIVNPVVEQLCGQTINLSSRSRVWWCPTGLASRLPLHAAGPFAHGKRNLPQIFISSYTPTLGTLIRARRLSPPSGDDIRKSVFVVGQPDTPNERPLPGVEREVQAIQESAHGAVVFLSSAGTREAVLSGLGNYPWLHLACHGHHHPTQPFQSSFSMYDGRITLLDLIGQDLPDAELAVLSACHSARVSESLPDEVLHPAAGLMFAGYRSVIGTMWALDDGMGAALSAKFYKLMLGGKNGPRDYSDAATALVRAFNALDREGRAIPITQRVNVVHYGV